MTTLELDQQLNALIMKGESVAAFGQFARVLAHAADGEISFSEWEFDLELEGMGRVRMVQVAVRR